MNRMERLAELAVTFGANVQPGQVLRISGEVGHCELTQVMAEVAYRRGARFVDVDLQDPFVHRARVMHAPSDTLGFAPNWPETRIRELDRQHGASITALRLDAVRLRGPGTDLVIGLPPSARWDQAGHVSERGIAHAWNLPSEEVFTVPDRDRVDGHARLTRPVRVAGRLVTGTTVAFSAGRVIDVSGGDGVATLREFIARDPGMTRLGELALVDAGSAVAGTGRTYGITLLDENAASHVALGFGFTDLVDDADRDRVNDAPDHLDVMVGTDEVEVTGRHADGHETPLLRAGRWQLGGER